MNRWCKTELFLKPGHLLIIAPSVDMHYFLRYPISPPQQSWTSIYLIQISINGIDGYVLRPKPLKYIRSRRLNEKEPSEARRRKNNSPVAQSEASAYFAEHTLLSKRLSNLISDTNTSTNHNIASSSNPLLSPHKDSRGRRRGISQRTELDTIPLKEGLFEVMSCD